MKSLKDSLRLRITRENFYAFFILIFSESLRLVEGEFVDGKHFKKWCDEMQSFKQTSRVSARKHGKSIVFYAFVMWQMWRQTRRFLSGIYFSYTSPLAADHLKNINRFIEANSHFKKFVKQTTAETYLHFSSGTGDEKMEFKVEPAGILEFSRGPHTEFVLCDDILRDPENEMNIDKILKVTRTFKDTIMSIPKEGGELHVSGTKQDEDDIFAVLARDPSFMSFQDDAYIDEKLGVPLWPEKFTTARLEEIRASLGNKSFSREYMCIPIRSSNAFFGRSEILDVIDETLPNNDPEIEIPLDNKLFEVRAGYDIGKKQHPSHLAVFEKRGNRIIQICSFWMDGWPYTKQIDLIKQAIKNLHIDRIDYDNTRGEFESLDEVGDLPPEMQPVVFTTKLKHSAATAFEKQVQNKTLSLVNDQRQFRQILNCDNKLQSVETPEGHGDSFWSNALAIRSFTEPEPGYRSF